MKSSTSPKGIGFVTTDRLCVTTVILIPPDKGRALLLSVDGRYACDFGWQDGSCG